MAGAVAAVKRQFPGGAVAADQQPVAACLAWLDADPGPAVIPVAFGAVPGRTPLPCLAGQAGGKGTGRAGASASDHVVGFGHGQHVTDPVALQVAAQARVGAIDLIPATQLARVLASSARAIMTRATFGLVANTVPAGMPAAAHRPGSLIHDFGTYSSRSISACPPGAA